MSQQFEYFTNTKYRLVELLGGQAADRMVADSMYSFTIGGNNYINNYLLAGSSQANYSACEFQALLISTIQEHIKAQTLSAAFQHINIRV